MSNRDSDLWFEAKAGGVRGGGCVYGLLADPGLATKLHKAANLTHLKLHSFDRAGKLIAAVSREKPVLVVFDWDRCEAESFKVLKELRENVDWNSVPAVGFVSQSKAAVRDEARKAGCDRVYMKAEFMRSLNDIFMRYAL